MAVALIITTIIWGSGFIATQFAIDNGLNTSAILALRFSIAAIALLLSFGKELRNISKKDFINGSITGFILYLGFFTQTLGLRYTTPANNALITASYVIIVPIISIVFTRKSPSLILIVSSVLCFVGLCAINIKDNFQIAFNNGDILTLFSAFFYALHIIVLEKNAKNINIKVLTILQVSSVAVFSILSFLIFEPSVSGFNSKPALLSVVYLALFGTYIAYIVQTYAQKVVKSTKLAIILSMESLFGAMFSVWFGYDVLSLQMVIGALLIFAALFLAEMKRENASTLSTQKRR